MTPPSTRTRHTWGLAGLLAAALMLDARPGGAAESTHPPVGIAVHPEIGWAFPAGSGPNSTPGLATIGLGAGYTVGRHLEIEVAGAHVMGGSRALAGENGAGTVFVDIDRGTLVRALLRVRNGDGRVRAVAAAGPALIAGGAFGTAPLLHVEGGLEMRAGSGLYALFALQLLEPLATSRPEVDPMRCLTDDCPSRFDPRTPAIGSRIALGFAF